MGGLILVVDDKADVADLFGWQFRRELRSARFSMEFAPSAIEALRRVDALETGPRADPLDGNMEGKSGLGLLPLARRALPEVRIIMITAYGDADTRSKAIERGAALFTKRIDFTELRADIDRRNEAPAGAA